MATEVNVPLAFRKMKPSGDNPNTGDGFLGPWPVEGDHDCLVTGITFSEKAKYFVNKEPLPATSVQLHYQVTGDPNQPSAEPFVWKGNPMCFPNDVEWWNGDDKKWVSARIDRDRLAGFFKIIMGRTFSPDTFGDDMMALATRLASVPVACKIKAEYRKYKKKDGSDGLERTDYCRESLQS